MSETPILETMRQEARAAGLSEEETSKLWSDYVVWSRENFPHLELGGRSWTRQIARHLDFRTTATSKRIEQERDRADREKREAAEYARQAWTFRAWILWLRDRLAQGFEVSHHDRQVLAWSALDARGTVIDFGSWHKHVDPEPCHCKGSKPKRETDPQSFGAWLESQGVRPEKNPVHP